MGYSGVMMPEPLRALTVRACVPALSCLLLLVGCAAGGGGSAVDAARADEKPMVSATAQEATPEQSASLMVAEVALERGDCRAAAEQYAKVAASSSEARVAARATQVSLACAQLEPARRAAARWRALDPYAGEAALAAAIIALKLYRLDEAKVALAAWRDSGAAGAQDPGQVAELLSRESSATAAWHVFREVLTGTDPTAEVLMAEARLAQQSFDLKAAIRLAERALELESRLGEAKVMIARARAMLGDMDGALALARQAQPDLSGEDAFIVADLLDAADQDDAAREELNRLRATPELAAAADRRLGIMALADGDLDAAEAQFTSMMGDRSNAAVALYYLAEIAERKGDDDTALKNYQLLANTGLGLTARNNAARLLLKKGQRQQALALLDEHARQRPEEAVEVAAARGQLFAGQGLFEPALADLEASLQRYPGHPTLEYTRATVLERAGRKRESVAALKSLLKKRPQDPEVANALGFTLADHGSELALAERLIRQALAVSPDSPPIQDSLGWVLYRRGKNQEALKILEHAYRNLHDPEIGAHYGEVLWVTGEQAKAHYIWQQVLATDPDNAVLRATVHRLTGEEPPRSQP